MTLQSYVIEVAGEAAGIVIQERGGFRFFAANSACASLNQHMFSSARSAEQSCMNLMRIQPFRGRAAERSAAGDVKPLAPTAAGFRIIAQG